MLASHCRKAHRAGADNAGDRVRFAPKNPFTRAINHFAEAIRAGVEPHTPGEAGLQDFGIIAAIDGAAAGGGQKGGTAGVVSTPAVPGLDALGGPPPK